VNERQGSLLPSLAGAEPLAARMRPRTLDEFVGQDAVVGPGRLLRRAIEADQLSSVIFFGPPGTGKTTLARVIAQTTRAHFVAINAVLAGVKDLREAVAEAKELRTRLGRKTILFVDEVHRFNKAQQDALLPWVEDGTVILVGATTENPWFEVNPALVSRSRLFRLEPLGPPELLQVARRALADPERGYGRRRVELAEEALAHLVDVSNGDARTLLNALELAVETTSPDASGVVRIDLGVAEESIQRRAVLYDREGDAHFDTISAFIKSIRGSDPDAALYWLARMLYAGEDPRFILRRLLILASEDVGLADPGALGAVVSCASAFDRVGMPEGRFHLSQATLVLATAPKSNSTMGVFDALAAVERERGGEVPVHLKDASRDGEGMGHGAGYLYPHAYEAHWVAQQYLPSSLVGRIFWQPSDQGHEGQLKSALERRREAQLAAMVEAAPEPWSFGAPEKGVDRWLMRTQGDISGRLERLRELVLDAEPPSRHHLVLDLDARTGLLLWEAVRRTPEGHCWARVAQPVEAEALRELASRLPELRRPRLVQGSLAELREQALEASVRFERVLGRELGRADAELVQTVSALLAPEGVAVLLDVIPRHAQRLSALLPEGALPAETLAELRRAEERVYLDPAEPITSWDLPELQAPFLQAGLHVQAERISMPGELVLTRAMLERWFSAEPSSLGSRIAREGGDSAALGRALRGLEGRTLPWSTTVGRLKVRLKPPS
jgi:putative ATPase